MVNASVGIRQKDNHLLTHHNQVKVFLKGGDGGEKGGEVGRGEDELLLNDLAIAKREGKEKEKERRRRMEGMEQE